MIKIKEILFKTIVAFTFLFACSSCNPYVSRRVPFGNSPYVACKNCKKNDDQQVIQNKDDYVYDFVSEEEQQEIKPLPLPKRKSSIKKVKTFKKKNKTSEKKIYIKPKEQSSDVDGKIKMQDLSKTQQQSQSELSSNSKNKKQGGYVQLSSRPSKKYSLDQHKNVLAAKKSSIQELSSKAKQVKNPNAQTSTLDTEQKLIAPTQKGKEQLKKKLQELQQQNSVKPSQQQMSTQTSQQTSVQSQQQSSSSKNQQTLTSQQAQSSTNKNQQQTSSKLQEEGSDASTANSATYDIKNKPIPLPK